VIVGGSDAEADGKFLRDVIGLDVGGLTGPAACVPLMQFLWTSATS